MKLFREGERTELGRIRPGQSAFDCLNESAQPLAVAARQVLQRCFDPMPAGCKPELVRRIRSDGPDHDAAIIEVYAHELLRVSGYDIQVSPTCPGGSSPDYLIAKNGYEALVEVTVDCGAAEQVRADAVLDAFFFETASRVTVPGFQIMVEERTIGRANPSPRRFARFLSRWFGSFDYATERAKLKRAGSFGDMPCTVYEEHNTGWRIEMRLYPLKSPDTAPAHIAASTGVTVGRCNSQGRLRDNIRDKTGQHRGCGKPLLLVIALNDALSAPDRDDVVDVLIGSSFWTMRPEDEGPAVHGRKAGGLWSPCNAHRSKRPAGLVLVSSVYPWSLERAEPALWDNPLAAVEHWLPSWGFQRFRWEMRDGGELRSMPARHRDLQTARGAART